MSHWGGMVNPMTAPGDLIESGDALGTPVALPAGNEGDVLSMQGGFALWAPPAAPVPSGAQIGVFGGSQVIADQTQSRVTLPTAYGLSADWTQVGNTLVYGGADRVVILAASLSIAAGTVPGPGVVLQSSISIQVNGVALDQGSASCGFTSAADALAVTLTVPGVRASLTAGDIVDLQALNAGPLTANDYTIVLGFLAATGA